MENVTFENFKYALVGFGVNVAVVGALAFYIFRGLLDRVAKLEIDLSELHDKHAETSAALRASERVCAERHEKGD